MTQKETIEFLSKNGMDMSDVSYNQINDIMAFADKIADYYVKQFLLTICECDKERKEREK